MIILVDNNIMEAENPNSFTDYHSEINYVLQHFKIQTGGLMTGILIHVVTSTSTMLVEHLEIEVTVVAECL